MRSQARPIDRSALEDLRRSLEDCDRFNKLVRAFIENAITGAAFGDDDTRRFRRNSLISISGECARAIEGAKSPIERVLLRSLQVNLLQSDGLGLIVHPTNRDASAEVAAFRNIVAQFVSLGALFRQSNSSRDLRQFLDGEMAQAYIAYEQRRYFLSLLMRYYYHAPLTGSFHVTLQPTFTNVIAGTAIRPDFYFWSPRYPNINVIVECDGFEFHSGKDPFTNDRRRDRAFRSRGYEVFRFSGSEINADPLDVASELAHHLWRLADQAEQTVENAGAPVSPGQPVLLDA